MNKAEEQMVIERIAAADVVGRVHVRFDDVRKLVWDVGPATIAILEDRVQIWSAYDSKMIVECFLSEVSEISTQKRGLSAVFAGKRYRLTFRGEDSHLTDADWDAMQSLVLQLFGVGDWTMPNPGHMAKGVAASVRNLKAAPDIARMWLDLLTENLTVSRARAVFGADVIHRAPIFSVAYREYWDKLELLAQEEYAFRHLDGTPTRRELLEAADDLRIKGRGKMTKVELVEAIIENRRTTRDFFMGALLGEDAVALYNSAVFDDPNE